MYSGISKLDADMVMPLWYAANENNISGMVQECRKFLKSTISKENVVFEVLQQAVLFDDKDIIEDCHSILRLHGREVLTSEGNLASEGFLSLTRESLRSILQMEGLDVKEEKIHSYCM